MTCYHGGKQKIGREISEIIFNTTLKICQEKKFDIEGYAEPFCGMMGVFQHIPELFDEYKIKYKAGDINKSLILMWKEAKRGWIPPLICSYKKYQELRYDGEETAEKGFLGHCMSFGGVYFSAYRDNYLNKKTNLEKNSDNVVRIATENLKKVTYSSGSYKKFSKLKNYVIYCDPPYDDCVSRYQEEFNMEDFLNWCVDMSKENIIFVSTYSNLPKKNGWKIVFKKVITTGGYNGRKNSGQEKLFVLY